MSGAEPRRVDRRVDLLAFALFVVGLVTRVAPLANAGGRVLRQFPTEDGYLMLTIARNLAIGRGMSAMAGTIPTNGTQPLFNFIEALSFLATSGDRASGVWLVLAASVLVSCIGAYAIVRLARAVLADRDYAEPVARIAGALWFASPVVLPHTMNCLETGLAVTCCAFALERWVTGARESLGDDTDAPRMRYALTLGASLALAFWARIDAVFLIATITTGHLVLARIDERRPYRARFIEAVVAGATSVVLASPWLIYNKLYFGHFTPISGLAQGYDSLGENLVTVPKKLIEYAALVVPIPERFESTRAALAASSIGVLIYSALVYRALVRSCNRLEALALATFLAHVAALIAYYGVFFGAAHFVGRYLAPVSIGTAILTPTLAAVVIDAVRASRPQFARVLAVALGSTAVALSASLGIRLYRNGTSHQHFQVVDWVEANVADDRWVGAVQTGTLGFFHDRTVNLDGKVNPAALEARLRDAIPTYVVEARFGDAQQPIEVIADWYGVERWKSLPPIRDHFDLVVADETANLVVFRRRP